MRLPPLPPAVGILDQPHHLYFMTILSLLCHPRSGLKGLLRPFRTGMVIAVDSFIGQSTLPSKSHIRRLIKIVENPIIYDLLPLFFRFRYLQRVSLQLLFALPHIIVLLVWYPAFWSTSD